MLEKDELTLLFKEDAGWAQDVFSVNFRLEKMLNLYCEGLAAVRPLISGATNNVFKVG